MNTTNPKKQIEVVAAIIEHNGETLCVQRGESKLDYISHKWEFPGGKIETGETAEQALRREIQEELKIAIEVRELVLTTDHEYPDFHIRIHGFRCGIVSDASPSDLERTEHIADRWLGTSDQAFKELDWAAADIPIVEILVTQSQPGTQSRTDGK
jgi:8-oxo-dGTP diphosphatase